MIVFQIVAVTGILLGITLLVMHFNSMRFDSIPTRDYRFEFGIAWITGLESLTMFVGLKESTLFIATSAVLTFSVTLYVILCNWLVFGGGAEKLRKWRGDKWVKEIDYVYLFFGSLGLFGVVNRLDPISDRITRLDVLAALIIAIAIVLRLIKTRAEIGKWA